MAWAVPIITGVAAGGALLGVHYFTNKFGEKDKQKLDAPPTANDIEIAQDKYERSKQNNLINESEADSTNANPNGFIFGDGTEQSDEYKKDSINYANTQAQLNAQAQAQDPTSAQNLKEIMQPTRYRNTGIPSIDYKQELTIGDLLLSRTLGLNLQYVDMNLNANVKNTDVTKTKTKLEGIIANANNVNHHIEEYEDENLGSLANRISRGIAATPYIGGIWGNFASDANLKQNTRDVTLSYNVARTMGNGKLSNQDIKNAQEVVSSKNTSQNGYYAKMAEINNLALNELNAEINTAQATGIPVSYENLLAREALSNLVDEYNVSAGEGKLTQRLRDNKQALELISKGDDESLAKAIKLIRKKDK